MESINNFNNGMDLDTNPLNIEKGKYIEGSNIRVINDINGTSHSVNNIKGNKFNITIPNTPIFQKITITGNEVSQSLTINGQTGLSFNTSGTTPVDLYNYIINSGAYTLLNIQYNIYYSNSYLLIVPITGFAVAITTSGSGLTLDSSFVPAQTGLEIIGSCNIRGDVYLFTTNNKTKNPGGHALTIAADPSSVGQVWKYTYDKTTLTGTLKLIYNNYVDFTTYYAISPTAATGRYENSGIQRIYWTDFFNKLRSLNVADPQALAFDISTLDVVPAIDMDRPVMTDMGNSGGSIKVGVYQSAYRFKNTGGATTNFSELSDLVYVVPSVDEHAAIFGGNFRNYIGGTPGSTANKQITWTMSNLDPDFDRIETAIIFKSNLNDVPNIFIISDEPVAGDTHTVTYDGTQDEIPLTLTEFLMLSSAFTHCKTVGTKDNRLFVGNIRNQRSEINYDARAFRAFTSGGNDVLLTNNGFNDIAITQSAASASNETTDAINKYSDVTRACFWKPGTSVLGGAGTNISYEFYTECIPCDIDATATNKFNVPDNVGAPWRHTNPDFNQLSLDLGVDSFSDDFTQVNQTIPTTFPNHINAGFKYPPYSSALRGFQRTEIYRFGIQFFDKSKNPTFVKWIGDIKMPDFFDPNPNAYFSNGDPAKELIGGVLVPVTNFKLSFTGSHVQGSAYNECYVQSLGIRFTVNIPSSLSEQIDGYSIVRVKREDSDKTVVSQGYIHWAVSGSDNNIYIPSLLNNSAGNGPIASIGDKGFFITPDICDGSLIAPTSSMSMKVKAALTNINDDNSILMGGIDPYYMWKYYNCLPPGASSGTYALEQLDGIGYAGNIDSITGVKVFNYDFSPLNITTSLSIGNRAYFFDSTTNIDYTGLLALSGFGKLLVNMERTLSSQYGGATYSNRSKNEYISCSHYRPVRNVSTALSDTFDLFGGDVFVNMYDSCRWSKNWGGAGRGVPNIASSGTDKKLSATFFFPVESTVNTELRSGKYMNKDFTEVSGVATPYESPGQEFEETYQYNEIYSAQCTSKLFYPKPDPFILNEEFDNRFYASEIKINGELADSWGIFKTNNYWDVEGTYGPINAMEILKDRMYFWQTRAFGVLQINPRAIITDVGNIGNSELEIGTGLPLQRHDYLSTELGLQHQWGLTKSNYKLFWLDVANRKFFSFGSESVEPNSDVKGMFSYLSNNLEHQILNIDKPVYNDTSVTPSIGINGVVAVYDFKYNQAIFTIHDGKDLTIRPSVANIFTFVFDERMNAFSSFYSHTPKIYFTDGYKIFSADPNNLSNIYMHDSGDYCRFYGTLYDSSIKFVVNDSMQYTKVFDNIMYDSQSLDVVTGINYNDDTWSSIRVYNDYQNTDFQTLSPGVNIKRKERTWQLAIPRNRVLYTASNSPNIFTDLSLTNKVMGERIRDKFIIVDLKYNNTLNRDLSFNNLKTLYRPSIR